LIPTTMAGTVIGRRGEFIQSLRNKYHAVLTVSDSGKPERIFTVICRQRDLKDCFTDILRKMAEDQEGRKLEVRLLVHDRHAGAIIGRGGTQVKELRERTNAQITVYTQCCPRSTDRVIKLSATREVLPNAIKILVDYLKEIPIKSIQQPYDAVDYDAGMAHEYGGIETDEQSDSRRVRGPPLLKSSSDELDKNKPISSTQVSLPTKLSGVIIGSGGKTINRIRQESGAQILIDGPHEHEETIITITGTDDEIQSAQFMLQQCVLESKTGQLYIAEHR